MSNEPVLYDTEGGVALLTLNRPQTNNEITTEMLTSISQLFKRANSDPGVHAVLITGQGDHFSNGVALEELASSNTVDQSSLGVFLEKNLNPIIQFIHDSDLIFSCAINGTAAGCAVALGLSCDLVYAGKKAQFIISGQDVGLIPDGGLTWLLPRMCSLPRAKGAMLLNKPISAYEAKEWGLIWDVLDENEILEHAFVQTRNLANGFHASKAITKRAINASLRNALDQQLDLEKMLQRSISRSDAHIKALDRLARTKNSA